MPFKPLVHLDPETVPTAPARWYITNDDQQILLIDGAIPVGVEPPVATATSHLLGIEDDVPIRAAVADSLSVIPEDGIWIGLRQLFGLVPDIDWSMAGRAVQVVTWDRDHRFCGRCGESTFDHHRDRAKECRACGLLSFPRLSPAVIMLVERGPEVLLAWGRQFPGRFFSALAGFVEPGESLEETVVREVREETSIEVDDVRYFGSQPWPFPHSLMIGFTATYSGGEIEIDPHEIVEAAWFSRTELPPVPTGGMSIAGWLIEDWLRRTV